MRNRSRSEEQAANLGLVENIAAIEVSLLFLEDPEGRVVVIDPTGEQRPGLLFLVQGPKDGGRGDPGGDEPVIAALQVGGARRELDRDAVFQIEPARLRVVAVLD